MKVRELIALLAVLPQEAEAVIDTETGIYVPNDVGLRTSPAPGGETYAVIDALWEVPAEGYHDA